MTIEQCLKEQMMGDFFFDGINEKDIWIDHICLAEILIIGDLDDNDC